MNEVKFLHFLQVKPLIRGLGCVQMGHLTFSMVNSREFEWPPNSVYLEGEHNVITRHIGENLLSVLPKPLEEDKKKGRKKLKKLLKKRKMYYGIEIQTSGPDETIREVALELRLFFYNIIRCENYSIEEPGPIEIPFSSRMTARIIDSLCPIDKKVIGDQVVRDLFGEFNLVPLAQGDLLVEESEDSMELQEVFKILYEKIISGNLSEDFEYDDLTFL